MIEDGLFFESSQTQKFVWSSKFKSHQKRCLKNSTLFDHNFITDSKYFVMLLNIIWLSFKSVSNTFIQIPLWLSYLTKNCPETQICCEKYHIFQCLRTREVCGKIHEISQVPRQSKMSRLSRGPIILIIF